MAYVYDDLGRVTSQTRTDGADVKAVSYEYDLAGNRTKMTWPDAFYVRYEYDNAGEMTAIRQAASTADVDKVAGFSYNELGERSTLTQGTSKTVSYGYDTLYRLNSLGIDLAKAGTDLNMTFGYNAAGQITSRTMDNPNYIAPAPGGQVTGSYNVDSLNRYTSAGSVTPTYDNRSNMTSDGSNSFTYDNENRLTKIGAGSSATNIAYDPLGRMNSKTGPSDNIRFVYDGADLIAEYDGVSGAVLRKYVHGPGVDEPMVWYEGSDTSDRRWMTADERGSIIATSTAPGGLMTYNTYDEYGAPGDGNTGRFGYTGQKWLAEGGVWDYKARVYSPKLGRFMQTDPIGYTDNMNAYAYVGNDPLNFNDPSGLAPPQTPPDPPMKPVEPPPPDDELTVTGHRPPPPPLQTALNTPGVVTSVAIGGGERVGLPDVSDRDGDPQANCENARAVTKEIKAKIDAYNVANDLSAKAEAASKIASFIVVPGAPLYYALTQAGAIPRIQIPGKLRNAAENLKSLGGSEAIGGFGLMFGTAFAIEQAWDNGRWDDDLKQAQENESKACARAG